jgi:hypothetical protein
MLPSKECQHLFNLPGCQSQQLALLIEGSIGERIAARGRINADESRIRKKHMRKPSQKVL